jgi:hypothetical protein
MLDPGVRPGGVFSRDRTKDAAVLRVALSNGSPAVCGGRSSQAGAWRGRVYRAGLGVRSAHQASGSLRSGRGRGGGSEAPPQKGGGRPPRAIAQPTLAAHRRHVWQECPAGEPMRAGVLGTPVSWRAWSRRLWVRGPPASRRTIRGLLSKRQLGQRPARKKTTMGPPPDRHAPCAHIARLRREEAAAGEAGMAIATKKKA